MTMITPNPRRTRPRGTNSTRDSREIQKGSHRPEQESHAQPIYEIGDEVGRVLHSQESGSFDQSANKWFSHANKSGVPGQQPPAALDGTFLMPTAPRKPRRR